MDAVIRFAAKCHRCGRDPAQTLDKEKLRQQLDESLHIEVYCIDCDVTRYLDAEERMRVRLKLEGAS